IGEKTGVARKNASDFIVALGDLKDPANPSMERKATDVEVAGTFMHELGHNLGLGHGGLTTSGAPSDATYKPNYLSVMNYLFQLEGLTHGGQGGLIDYSHVKLLELNEYKQLSEAAGLGTDAADYGTRWFCPGYVAGTDSPALIANAQSSVNWNCSGTPKDATGKWILSAILPDTEINVWACINGQGHATCDAVLAGSKDWGSLKLAG
ncbi:MAG: M66 family metalloprotease, partial [Candidatus Solibacter sp.]|nr:M66 family metalloprotease [Candidatus Solibacter sp.]